MSSAIAETSTTSHHARAPRSRPTILRARSAVRRASGDLRRASGDLAPILTAILLIAPVVAAALFCVWTRVATVRLGYELSRASDEQRALAEENRGLRIEVAALKTPKRLEQLAKEQGLAPPRPGQIVRVASAEGVRK